MTRTFRSWESPSLCVPRRPSTCNHAVEPPGDSKASGFLHMTAIEHEESKQNILNHLCKLYFKDWDHLDLHIRSGHQLRDLVKPVCTTLPKPVTQHRKSRNKSQHLAVTEPNQGTAIEYDETKQNVLNHCAACNLYFKDWNHLDLHIRSGHQLRDLVRPVQEPQSPVTLQRKGRNQFPKYQFPKSPVTKPTCPCVETGCWPRVCWYTECIRSTCCCTCCRWCFCPFFCYPILHCCVELRLSRQEHESGNLRQLLIDQDTKLNEKILRLESNTRNLLSKYESEISVLKIRNEEQAETMRSLGEEIGKLKTSQSYLDSVMKRDENSDEMEEEIQKDLSSLQSVQLELIEFRTGECRLPKERPPAIEPTASLSIQATNKND